MKIKLIIPKNLSIRKPIDLWKINQIIVKIKKRKATLSELDSELRKYWFIFDGRRENVIRYVKDNYLN